MYSTSVLIHTTMEKSEDAALFLRFGLPSTLILQETEPFRNTLLRVDGKHLKNARKTQLFEDDVVTTNHTISITESSSKTKPKPK